MARSIETQTEVLLEIAVQRRLAAADTTTHQLAYIPYVCLCAPAVIVCFGSLSRLVNCCDADERDSLQLDAVENFIDIKVYRLSHAPSAHLHSVNGT